jgi:hypothetical protein
LLRGEGDCWQEWGWEVLRFGVHLEEEEDEMASIAMSSWRILTHCKFGILDRQ